VIAAVVLTFAAPDGMLEACVDSLLDAQGIDCLIVVDNGDRAADRLKGRPLDLIVMGANLGYAGGMNAGIDRALDGGADHVLVLNDDVVVEPGFVVALVAELATDARIGAVQPKLLYDDGDPPIVNSVGVELGHDGAGRDIGIGEPDGPTFMATREIELFTGGAVLLRAEFLRAVGRFDERYFLYYEDIDLGLRGRKAGWTFRCVPASVVHHRGSAATSGPAVANRVRFLRERNRLWILLRYRPFGDLSRGLWLSIRRLRHPPRMVHARALVAGLGSAPRLLAQRVRRR
jgi:hypothetical protein